MNYFNVLFEPKGFSSQQSLVQKSDASPLDFGHSLNRPLVHPMRLVGNNLVWPHELSYVSWRPWSSCQLHQCHGFLTTNPMAQNIRRIHTYSKSCPTFLAVFYKFPLRSLLTALGLLSLQCCWENPSFHISIMGRFAFQVHNVATTLRGDFWA